MTPLRRTTATGGKRFALFSIVIFMFLLRAQASSVGSNAGLALFRISGARASALGEAFTAVDDDITALEFNPGSLGTLKSNDVSLQHQTGLIDDSFSKALLGLNVFGGAAGVTVGRYDSGKANLFDGLNQKSVTAEQDWATTIGYGKAIGPVEAGMSVRYLSSRLAESYSSSAESIEAGVQIPFNRQLRVGISGPLVQSKLKYADVSEDLPKVYRVGLATDLHLDLATGRLPLKLLVDMPYDSHERLAWVAGGAETTMGPMSFRVGYNAGSDINNFSFGAGFAFSRINIDYSFGMVDTGFNSLHRVSFSLRFGSPPSLEEVQRLPTTNRKVVLLGTSPSQGSGPSAAWTQDAERAKYLVALEKQKLTKGQTYVVKPGETLKGIAQEIYGDDSWEGLIFYDNRDKVGDPNALPAGVKLTLP